jgi:hypothetical protein
MPGKTNATALRIVSSPVSENAFDRDLERRKILLDVLQHSRDVTLRKARARGEPTKLARERHWRTTPSVLRAPHRAASRREPEAPALVSAVVL